MSSEPLEELIEMSECTRSKFLHLRTEGNLNYRHLWDTSYLKGSHPIGSLICQWKCEKPISSERYTSVAGKHQFCEDLATFPTTAFNLIWKSEKISRRLLLLLTPSTYISALLKSIRFAHASPRSHAIVRDLARRHLAMLRRTFPLFQIPVFPSNWKKHHCTI